MSNIKNLLTDYDDTMLAMALVEGEAWLDYQLSSQPTEYSAPSVVAYLKSNDFSQYGQKPEELGPVATVYGSCGFNRWPVLYDGQVLFSKMHASSDKEKLEKVKGLGFKLQE